MSRPTTRRRDIDRTAVRAEVAAAERRTSAEIVVSIGAFFLGDVGAAAERVFRRLGIARLRRRNGVLVFVVPARHRVVILPDEEAAARIDPAIYEECAALIADASARGFGTQGIIAAVQLLADVLAVAFPYTGARADELPDLTEEGARL